MSNYQTILYEVDGPFARITLNRPQVRNAMNFQMVDELIGLFGDLRERQDIRAVVLRGADDVFCSGGDIQDLHATEKMSRDQQWSTVGRLDTLLRTVNQAPQVVIASVEGAALGGGFGLVCVSDIAISSTTALFGLPEVRRGLIPAVISPFVIQRLGMTRSRLLMLTGATFDGVSAHEYGLVQEVCPSEILSECTDAVLRDLRNCSPRALAACKQLLFEVMDKPLESTLNYRVGLLNRLRSSDEGQEGMAAFLEKRPPKWAE
jgi:enoyl-CoA hydratase/carnithine racemase